MTPLWNRIVRVVVLVLFVYAAHEARVQESITLAVLVGVLAAAFVTLEDW